MKSKRLTNLHSKLKETRNPRLKKVLVKEILKVQAREKEVNHQQYMRETVEACRNCGLGEIREQAFSWRGSLTKIDLGIVTGPPTIVDERRGKLLAGQGEALIEDALKRAGGNIDRTLILPAIACHPPKDRDPSAKELRACSGNLAMQLEASAVAVGVTLGRVATAAVMGMAKSNVKENGDPFWVDGRIWVSTSSIQEMVKNQDRAVEVTHAFQTALALRWGRRVLPVPPHEQIEFEGKRGVSYLPLLESQGWILLHSKVLNCQITVTMNDGITVPENLRHLPSYLLDELIKIGLAGKGRRSGWTREALRTMHMVRSEFKGTVIVG